MTQWPSTKAKRVLAALLRIGWRIKRETGSSHKILEREDSCDVVFAFHDGDEIGPRMLARIAKTTGLTLLGFVSYPHLWRRYDQLFSGVSVNSHAMCISSWDRCVQEYKKKMV